MLLIQQQDYWWTRIAYFNVGWTVIQLKPLPLRDESNQKQKLNIYLKALAGIKELKDCMSIKDVISAKGDLFWNETNVLQNVDQINYAERKI